MKQQYLDVLFNDVVSSSTLDLLFNEQIQTQNVLKSVNAALSFSCARNGDWTTVGGPLSSLQELSQAQLDRLATISESEMIEIQTQYQKGDTSFFVAKSYQEEYAAILTQGHCTSDYSLLCTPLGDNGSAPSCLKAWNVNANVYRDGLDFIMPTTLTPTKALSDGMAHFHFQKPKDSQGTVLPGWFITTAGDKDSHNLRIDSDGE